MGSGQDPVEPHCAPRLMKADLRSQAHTQAADAGTEGCRVGNLPSPLRTQPLSWSVTSIKYQGTWKESHAPLCQPRAPPALRLSHTHTHARVHTHRGQQPMHIHKPQQWQEGAPADGWWVCPENQPKAASWGQTQTRFSPLRERKGKLRARG